MSGPGRAAVRPSIPTDRAWVDAFLESVGATRVARCGESVRPIDQPMLIAAVDGVPAGLLTHVIADRACEILTLHVVERWRGTGTMLLEAARERARLAGCTMLWAVTTNDNLDGLRFYQRRGFRIRSVRPGAVDDARRRLKPEIPEIGEHGIPIRDEIELELGLDRA